MPQLMGGELALLATDSVGVGGRKNKSELSIASNDGDEGVGMPLDLRNCSIEKLLLGKIGVGTCSVGVDLTT